MSTRQSVKDVNLSTCNKIPNITKCQMSWSDKFFVILSGTFSIFCHFLSTFTIFFCTSLELFTTVGNFCHLLATFGKFCHHLSSLWNFSLFLPILTLFGYFWYPLATFCNFFATFARLWQLWAIFRHVLAAFDNSWKILENLATFAFDGTRITMSSSHLIILSSFYLFIFSSCQFISLFSC